MDIDAMTDREIIDLMQADTPFARAAKMFRSAIGQFEQDEMQRTKPTPLQRRRAEFKALQRIAAELPIRCENSMAGSMTRDQVTTALEAECALVGGIRPWARMHGLDPGFVCHVIAGRRDPGLKMLGILRLKEVKIYEVIP